MGPRRVAVWIVGIISWTYLFIVTDFQLVAIAIWSVPFLLVLAVVSIPWRSVSWSTLLGLFMAGMGPVLVSVVLVQRLIELTPLEEWVRTVSGSDAFSGISGFVPFPSTVFFAPILEEIFKVLPLLILVVWKRSRIRTLAGPVDYAVMAGATGAGFGFGEDILVYLSQGNLRGPTGDWFALRLGPVYRSLFDVTPAPFDSDYTNLFSVFFAEMQYIGGVVWSGHGGLAMGLGLTIGLSVWGARRLKTKLVFVAIPIVYLWVVWEHIIANWYGGAGCARDDVFMCTLADVDLTGRIFPIVALAGFGLAIYMCSKAIRYYRSQDPFLESLDSDSFSISGGFVAAMRYISDWFAARRSRRKAAYGVETLRHARRVYSEDVDATLASRLRAMTYQRKLQGTTEVDGELEAQLTRAAPVD